MRAYVLSRLGQTALVIFLALTAVFFLVRLGGDPVLLFLPMDIQAKDVNEFRQRLGFNDPLLVQYGRFVAGAVRGDFGESLRYRKRRPRPRARAAARHTLAGRRRPRS